jgi:predicted nucleic acid-binding protein
MQRSGAEPAPRLVLDTTTYSHLRRGHSTVLDLIAHADVIIVPVTVLGELEGAFHVGSRSSENRRALSSFLSEPTVTTAHTTPSVARRYGQIYAQLRRDGQPIPTNDMWIAAAAVDTGGCLLTFDRHFDHVEGLDLIILPLENEFPAL